MKVSRSVTIGVFVDVVTNNETEYTRCKSVKPFCDAFMRGFELLLLVAYM